MYELLVFETLLHPEDSPGNQDGDTADPVTGWLHENMVSCVAFVLVWRRQVGPAKERECGPGPTGDIDRQ